MPTTAFSDSVPPSLQFRLHNNSGLALGRPNDPYEREADAIADQVVMHPGGAATNPSMAGYHAPAFQLRASARVGNIQMKCKACERQDQLQMKPNPVQPVHLHGNQPTINKTTRPAASTIQRKCEACEQEEAVQLKPSSTDLKWATGGVEGEDTSGGPIPYQNVSARSYDSTGVQMKCHTCDQEDPVQFKPSQNDIMLAASSHADADQAEQGRQPAYISPELTRQIKGAVGGGQSMSPQINATMSERIGADFSKVKIHTDQRAAKLTQALDARAFTYGKDIFFSQGAYDPFSTTGKHLLAHELVHTVQQGMSAYGNSIQRQADQGEDKVMILVLRNSISVLDNGEEILKRNFVLNDETIRLKHASPQQLSDQYDIYAYEYRVDPSLCRNGRIAGYTSGNLQLTIELGGAFKEIEPYLLFGRKIVLCRDEDCKQAQIESYQQWVKMESMDFNVPPEDLDGLSTDADPGGDSDGAKQQDPDAQKQIISDIAALLSKVLATIGQNDPNDTSTSDDSLEEIERLNQLMDKDFLSDANSDDQSDDSNTLLDAVISRELHKFIAGKTFDPTLPFLDSLAAVLNDYYKTEKDLFHALVFGASQKNDTIGDLFGDLIDAMEEARKIKLSWKTLLNFAPFVGPLHKLNKLYSLSEAIYLIYDLSDDVEEARKKLTGVSDLYDDIGKYIKLLDRIEQEESDNFQLINELETEKNNLYNRLITRISTEVGGLLDVFFIPADAGPEEMEELVLNIPAGISAFQLMMSHYEAVENGNWGLRDQMLGKAAEAGYFLYPLVGFLLNTIIDKVENAGGGGGKRRPKRKQRAKTNDKKSILVNPGTYKESSLNHKKAFAFVREEIAKKGERKGGQQIKYGENDPKSEIERKNRNISFKSPKAFRKAVKGAVKKFNKTERKNYKNAETGKGEKVKFPKIKLLNWKHDKGDKGELVGVKLKLNPEEEPSYFISSYKCPTGEKGDPVLIKWFKQAKDYLVIIQSDPEERYNKTGRSYKAKITEGVDLMELDVTDPDLQYVDDPNTTQGLKTGIHYHVDPRNLKSVNSELEYRYADINEKRNNKAQSDFNEALANSGAWFKDDVKNYRSTPNYRQRRDYKDKEYQVDHVLDMGLGGANDNGNLWPTSAAVNRGFNAGTQFQFICYYGESVKLHTAKKRRAASQRLWVKATKSEYATDPLSCDGTEPNGATKSDPIEIGWSKKLEDYAVINGKTIKDGVRLGPGKFLKPVDPRYYQPDIVNVEPWNIKRSVKEGNENVKKIRKWLNDTKESVFLGAQKLWSPRKVNEKVMAIDHVEDWEFSKKEKDNLWPLAHKKNDAANAVWNQYVGINIDGQDVVIRLINIKKMAKKPSVLHLRVVKVETPDHKGDHGTDTDKPSGAASLTKK